MFKRKAIFIIAALASSAAGYGQAGFGSLSGTVTDSTQAVISNAQVVLTLPNGEQRTTLTNEVGVYQFIALPPGSGYSESVTLSGFQTSKVSGLSVSVGTTLTQNVAMLLGAESQSVTVSTANIEQVQTTTSSVSQLIDSTIWRNSPLEDRTQNAFVTLVAGAAPDSKGSDGGSTTSRGAAVSGARTGTGNFLVEGMDNNDQGQGGAGFTFGGGGAVTTISPDVIQEYRVITHNPSAEYGRAGGFATDTSLKSGTNKFHGSLFEYNRIQALAANSWFSNYNGEKDKLIRNQFGGSIGGPLFRDRTFFYAGVEIHHLRQGSPVTGLVTTQAFLDFIDSGAFEAFQESDPNGVCLQYTGAACPGAFAGSAHLGSTFQALRKAEPNAFPLATSQFSNMGAGYYTAVAPAAPPNSDGSQPAITYPVPIFGQVGVSQHASTNQERASFKLDHKLSDIDQLSATYLVDLETSVTPFAGGATTFGPDEDQVGGSQLFTMNETHTFSPSLQNVFRIGYTRHVSNFLSPNTAGVPSIASEDPLAEGLGATSGLPQLFTDNEFLYEDSLSKIVRDHTLKFGFRFIRTRNGSSFYNDVNGTVDAWDTESLLTDENFNGEADAALANSTSSFYPGPGGYIAEASASVDSTTGLAPNVYRGFRANEFAAYFQDDWKVSKRLTLNLGLRWEYFGPPHNAVPGLDSNVFFGPFAPPVANGNPFLPNTPITGAIQSATFIQKNGALWNKDTNNFGPRFGFAYDPSGSGKTAIRGGFGLGYDRLYNNVYENIRFNSPHFSDNTTGIDAGGDIITADQKAIIYQVPFTGNAAFSTFGGKPVPRHIDQRLVTAYYEQVNFGIEHELAKGYVLETNYIATLGRKLVGLRDANNYDGRVACASLTDACAAAGYTAPFTTHRPSLLFNGDNFRSNGFSSNYSGLQVSVRKGFSNGLMFLANYTYSKSMDEISDVFSPKTGSAGTGITDPTNPSYDYGPADFDLRNLASFTANYEPTWKEKNRLLGGWGISPIATITSGSPVSVIDTSSSYDPNKDARHLDRAVYVGGGTLKSAVHRGGSPGPNGTGVFHVADFGDYTCPTSINQGLWCDPPVQRNSFFGPHYANIDLGITKRILLKEGMDLTFEGSLFNIFNHPNFANPISDLNNPNFGKSQATASDPRVTQLSLRYDF